MQCSLAYAPPEVLHNYAAGMRVAAHPAADIWALGVMVYEALTDGAVFPPYTTTPGDVYAAASGSARYPWELDRDAQFSRYRVRPAVEACLARDPAARPSAVQLITMIDRLANVTGTGGSSTNTTLCAETDSGGAGTPAAQNYRG